MKLSQLKQIIKEEVRKVLEISSIDANGFQPIEGNYYVQYKGPSLSSVGTLVKLGDKGGMYKVGRTTDGRNNIVMIGVDNASNRIVFASEAKMLTYLQDYVDPKGGTQSSQF